MILSKPRAEVNSEIAAILCRTPHNDLEQCYKANCLIRSMPCYCRGQCRIAEKSDQQVKYVYSPVTGHLFLEACPGSGKTEVVGFKAAYEMQRWEHRFNGMAVLTFTNTAANEIQERVRSFTRKSDNYPHFIGTFDSWLHSFVVQPFGYKVENYPGKQSDLAMRLIEDRTARPFLSSYKVWSKNNDMHLLANQYTWDPYSECFYYYPRGERTILPPSRGDNTRLEKTKRRLWGAGFFTYDDADAICYLLGKGEEGRRLATRFPYIIVDECQDLSPCKLGFLRQLAKHGSQIHLVGDLSQSIFGFTGADPVKTLELVNDLDFTRERLSQNYRSLQPIVDISCAIIGQSEPRLSCSSSVKDSSVVVFEYPDNDFLTAVPGKFVEFLEIKAIPIDESVIMARGKSTLRRLGATTALPQNKMVVTLANVCHQWLDTDSLFKRDLVLSQFGRFIYNVFFEDIPLAGYRTYSCPEGYSPIQWRILLFNILNNMKASQDIAGLEQGWSCWLASIKAFFRKDVCSAEGWSEDKLKMLKSPSGKKNEPVDGSVDKNSTHLPVRATTIHDIKGETVGAALLVSSPDRRGSRGGHWTDWLSGDDPEHTRFAYVASSRPVHTLAWAVPRLTEEQRRQILDLGFDEIIQWAY